MLQTVGERGYTGIALAPIGTQRWVGYSLGEGFLYAIEYSRLLCIERVDSGVPRLRRGHQPDWKRRW